MIQLLPVTEQAMLERLNRIYQQNAQFAYVCVEKREIKASCLYNIKGDVVEIVNVSSVPFSKFLQYLLYTYYLKITSFPGSRFAIFA
ncbi:MAG: hypothetical protein KH056_10595, partial [Clostridiales bacterium]|nr:hypothetical protein [Clostridiales bacterium]